MLYLSRKSFVLNQVQTHGPGRSTPMFRAACYTTQLKFLLSFLAWLIVAGISAIVTVVCLGFFSLFAILHVAMQLQRKEIMVSFGRAIFLKVVAAAVAGRPLTSGR